MITREQWKNLIKDLKKIRKKGWKIKYCGNVIMSLDNDSIYIPKEQNPKHKGYSPGWDKVSYKDIVSNPLYHSQTALTHLMMNFTVELCAFADGIFEWLLGGDTTG